MGSTALIAIDWGTTTARAYCLDRGGDILGRRSAQLGVQQICDGAFAAALAQLLGDWSSHEVPRIACGMIGSRQGWVEAPYVECPAAFDSLSRRATRTWGGELVIVPGLITRDAHGVPDVMRGEETQLAGAVAIDERQVLAVLPGTHSKWARVDAGSIVDFATYVTGELYAVLLAHSILGRLAQTGLAAPSESDAAFVRGVTRGVAKGDLAHDVFGARTLVLAGELAPGEVSEWLSGLLIGREIRAARAWAQAAGFDASRVRVIGSDTLVDRYLRALSLAGIIAEAAQPDAAVRGLHCIARAMGLTPSLE